MQSKQAHIRYMTIDEELRKDEGVFMEDLIKSCKQAVAYETAELIEDISISNRTIQDDLKFFRDSYNVKIVEERRDYFGDTDNHVKPKGKRKTYRYSDRNFSIAKLPITRKEREKMMEALGVLYRLSHMSSLHWLKETIQELQLIRSDGIPDEGIISFEENALLKGVEHLRPLYEAACHKKALEIKYFSFKEQKEFDFTISSYFLKQYNKRWFLFGKSHKPFLENPDRLLNLPLDRILSIQNSEETFIPNQGQSPSEYFKDIIGVTFLDDEKKIDITIQVDASHFHYLESKPLHSSQEVLEKNEEFVLIKISVYPNIELESLIFSNGEYLKVIAPAAFKNRIAERLKKMAEKY